MISPTHKADLVSMLEEYGISEVLEFIATYCEVEAEEIEAQELLIEAHASRSAARCRAR
jgi:hypothetical protein